MEPKLLPDFSVVDDFCGGAEAARESALQSGFGTWRPNKGLVGSSIYEGMSFHGKQAILVLALSQAIRRQIYPNAMFFRSTNEKTEKAYVHSDREDGSWTCIAYLSEHPERSGTAFYRHRKSGLTEMPTFEDQKANGLLPRLQKDMVRGGSKNWEQLDFIRAKFNRALIFRAPLFHSRFPFTGFGKTPESGRMVWVCHFEII